CCCSPSPAPPPRSRARRRRQSPTARCAMRSTSRWSRRGSIPARSPAASSPRSGSSTRSTAPSWSPCRATSWPRARPRRGPRARSLAESWTVSADGKPYEFKLREGLKFHNGDPFTAEDVKFSFQRSKVGKVLKDRVRDVEIVSPTRVRFHLHEPFPDFMALYG